MTNFLTNLWLIFLEGAPYLMVGFVVAGILHQYLPPSFVQKHLGGSSPFNIFKASLIGTPVPLCSCGVVPVGLGLQKDGASKATTVSFLISTPENGVESISLTYSFFGLPFTIARIVFAIVVANLTALTVHFWGEGDDKKSTGDGGSCCDTKPSSCCSPPPEPIGCCGPEEIVETPTGCCGSAKTVETSSSCCGPKEKRNGFRFVVDDFVPSIARWLILGFLISAAISTFLPQDFLSQVDSHWAIPLAALVGIPMYVCASASTPIAFSLFASGLSPGACLVFLLTGPATNSANFPIYLKVLGRRVTALYYGGIFFFSVLIGLLFDPFLQGTVLPKVTDAAHHHFHPGPFHYIGAVGLFVLTAYGLWKNDVPHR